MRLPVPELPSTGASGLLANLIKAVSEYLKLIRNQVNRLSDGSIAGSTSASNAPPASNSAATYAAGDFIRNTAPSQTGTAGSQYVILGWLCIAPGKPGTWIACRCLTGN